MRISIDILGAELTAIHINEQPTHYPSTTLGFTSELEDDE